MSMSRGGYANSLTGDMYARILNTLKQLADFLSY